MKRFLPLFVAVLIPIMAQAVASYTIYPIPHRQVIDESSSASFTSSVNIVAGPAIDQATINRAKDVLEYHGIATIVSAKTLKGMSNLVIGVYGSSDRADRLTYRMHLDKKLFSMDKYDRHILSITADKAGNAQTSSLARTLTRRSAVWHHLSRFWIMALQTSTGS